jgi:glycerophosphoryl diester phosphodiesterase
VTPITFAHRGGRADDAPENSLAAFRRALELGATGLESDARLSADGQVVLVHGPMVRTGLRRTRVRSLPADRLAELGVPRLVDLYAAVGTDFELSLDLKEPDLTGPIVAVAREAGALDRLWLCARELAELESARRVEPDVRLVHSMGRRAYGDALERHASKLAKAGVAALNLREAEWSLSTESTATTSTGWSPPSESGAPPVEALQETQVVERPDLHEGPADDGALVDGVEEGRVPRVLPVVTQDVDLVGRDLLRREVAGADVG